MSAPHVTGTAWASIACLFFAGCTTAMHIGKVPSALPLLSAEWQLSLTQAGLIVAVHGVFIATTGLLLGMLVRKTGYARFAIAGVAIAGMGSVLGAQTESLPGLLATRGLEGLGWILAVIALPTLLTRLSTASDRPLVMGIWGGFVPLGAGGMLILSPTLQAIGGWQLSWWFAGVVSLSAALMARWVVIRHREALDPLPAAAQPSSYEDLRQPVVWLLCLSFFTYSMQFVSVTSFLPTLFVQTSSLSLSSASRIVALVIMANAVGNVLAGAFLRRGVSYVRLLITGALSSAFFAWMVFSASVPLAWSIAAAFGFSMMSGLIPGTLFATLPRAATSASAAGLLVGLMMQWSGVGQLLGGILIPGVVDYYGQWQAASVVVLLAGLSGSLLAWIAGRQSFVQR